MMMQEGVPREQRRRGQGVLRAARILAAMSSVLSFGLLGGCVSDPYGDRLPDGSSRQASVSWRLWGPTKQLWVLVVDDAPTDDGRALRAQLAEELEGSIDQYRRSSSCNEPDLAVYEPMDIRLLVIPSSDPASAIHGAIDPSLDLITENAMSSQNRAWERGLGAAILAMESEELMPNRIFAALSYWDELLEGERPPRNEADEALLANLEKRGSIRVLIAATRDDESESRLSDPLFGSSSPPEWSALVYNQDVCASSYGYWSESLPRLARWAHPYGIGCRAPLFWRGGICEGTPVCPLGNVALMPDGRAACRIRAQLEADRECPEELGWFEVPATEEVLANSERICEIRQLEGDALASCRSDLDCAACEPGFCFRGPFPGLKWDETRYCVERGGWSWQQMRLVRGANSVLGARLTVTCELE